MKLVCSSDDTKKLKFDMDSLAKRTANPTKCMDVQRKLNKLKKLSCNDPKNPANFKVELKHLVGLVCKDADVPQGIPVKKFPHLVVFMKTQIPVNDKDSE